VAGLDGRRVVVVGASAGIGRAVAVRAVRAGARTVLAARRKAALEEAVAEAGGGTAVAVDVVDPEGVERLAREARAALGGPVDLVVHTVGYAAMRFLADCDGDTWRSMLDVNVVGLNQTLRAIVPAMAPGGIVAALSSETAAAPRTGLVAYAASKAAVEASLKGWRVEHPEVRFCCAVVGATQPTEFGAGFDAEVLGPALDSWARHGLLQEEFMQTGDVADVLLDVLGTALAHPGVGVETLVLRSPSPVIGTDVPARDHAARTVEAAGG